MHSDLRHENTVVCDTRPTRNTSSVPSWLMSGRRRNRPSRGVSGSRGIPSGRLLAGAASTTFSLVYWYGTRPVEALMPGFCLGAHVWLLMSGSGCSRRTRPSGESTMRGGNDLGQVARGSVRTRRFGPANPQYSYVYHLPSNPSPSPPASRGTEPLMHPILAAARLWLQCNHACQVVHDTV
jgi:hypothetical protein